MRPILRLFTRSRSFMFRVARVHEIDFIILMNRISRRAATRAQFASGNLYGNLARHFLVHPDFLKRDKTLPGRSNDKAPFCPPTRLGLIKLILLSCNSICARACNHDRERERERERERASFCLPLHRTPLLELPFISYRYFLSPSMYPSISRFNLIRFLYR